MCFCLRKANHATSLAFYSQGDVRNAADRILKMLELQLKPVVLKTTAEIQINFISIPHCLLTAQKGSAYKPGDSHIAVLLLHFSQHNQM